MLPGLPPELPFGSARLGPHLTETMSARIKPRPPSTVPRQASPQGSDRRSHSLSHLLQHQYQAAGARSPFPCIAPCGRNADRSPRISGRNWRFDQNRHDEERISFQWATRLSRPGYASACTAWRHVGACSCGGTRLTASHFGRDVEQLQCDWFRLIDVLDNLGFVAVMSRICCKHLSIISYRC